MLLLCVTVSCVLVGATAGLKFEELCYGSNFILPYEYMPPLFRGPLFFTPSGKGREHRKLMMENGEAKDPRIKVKTLSVHLMDLKKTDEGMFSISSSDSTHYNVINLKILDCADKVTLHYGDYYSFNIPRQAEYLEFTPLRSAEQSVLWNRTNPRTNKEGRVKIKWNTGKIDGIIPQDSGYYNLRKNDNTLLSRTLLTVKENERHYDTKVNEKLLIQNPHGSSSWSVTFIPMGKTEKEHLTIEGNVVTEDEEIPKNFHRRIQLMSNGIKIDPVKNTDSGTFEFRDADGNLAQTVLVEVEAEHISTFVYVIVIAGIISAVILCCCCVAKCCCKKSSSKRDGPAPTVHYLGQNQLAGPTYSDAPPQRYSYQPASHPPATTSSRPPVHSPINVHVNPSQPEVSAPGTAPAPTVNSEFFTSDPEPVFELKGIMFPSVLPLSSESAVCDVYNSDKLNFL